MWILNTFMTNTEFVYEISERNSQICVFWYVIVTHLWWRHRHMVQWVEFHPMNILSIGSTTKSMMDPKKTPVCHNWPHNVSGTKLHSHIQIRRSLRRLHRKFGVLMYNEYRETTYVPQLRHNVSDENSYTKMYIYREFSVPVPSLTS